MLNFFWKIARKGDLGLALTLLCLFLFSTAARAATTLTASSCAQADVQKAIRTAQSGDTVLIPGPCSPTWSTGVKISSTQAVTLEPKAGIVSIWGAPALIIEQNAFASTRVTGLAFMTIGRSSHPTILILGKFSPPSATARIDHNTFSSTSSGTWIETAGGAPVLIDHNSLSAGAAAEMIHNVAFGPTNGTRVGWTSDVTPGSANMVFIEDNTFTCTDKIYVCNMVQSYYGARTVVRHNVAYFSQVDQHGTQGLPWARWWEIYDNTFYTQGLSQCCYLELRGGSGVVWGNVHKAVNKVLGAIGLHVEAPGCSGKYPSSGYPVPDQVGRGLNQTSSPAYLWDNSADMPVLVGLGRGCLARKTDYYVSRTQPATLIRCQSVADQTAGCPIFYKYVPFKYPFPLGANGLPNPEGTSEPIGQSRELPICSTFWWTSPTLLTDLIFRPVLSNLYSECTSDQYLRPRAYDSLSAWKGLSLAAPAVGVVRMKVASTRFMLLEPSRLTSDPRDPGNRRFLDWRGQCHAACKALLVFVAAPFCLFFISAPLANAACTGASPTWTATIDQASVSTCITNASSGDTINVASGSATWSSVAIPSNKGLTLTCPSLSCSITGSADGYITINTGNTASGSALIGFNLSGGGNGIWIYLASAPPYNSTPRISNNTFTGSGTQINVQGFGPALIDHNTITSQVSADETIHLWGGQAGCSSCWNIDLVPGGANMTFFENNVWNAPSGGYCQGEEAYYGAVFVLRHNILNGCQLDAHGAGPSARWLEIYDNTYNNCCSSSSDFDWRGGSGVYWGNVTNSRQGSTDTSLGPICGSSDVCGTYPVQYQFGMGINGTNYSPVYVWGSDYSSTSAHSITLAMVQVGTAPSDPVHCSGLSGSLCNAIVTTSQPSTLERCESAADVSAGCPVSYAYTPYTYPHPLDNCQSTQYGAGATCGSTGPGAPAAPTNLKALVH